MATNTSARCILDLPVELLHIIFRCILDESSTFDDTSPQNKLIALSQTSSRIRSLAISFVYECMSFENIITWNKFLSATKSNPDHALWVKKLSVFAYEEDCVHWKDIVLSGLHLFAGVRKLILEGDSIPAMMDKLPRSCDLFPSLQFCKIIYRVGDSSREDPAFMAIPLKIESLCSIWTSRDLRYLYLQGLGFESSNKESIDLQKKLKPVELLVVHNCLFYPAEPAQCLPYRGVVQLILRETELERAMELFINNFTDGLVDLEYDPPEHMLDYENYEDIPAAIKWPDLRIWKNLKTLRINAFSLSEMMTMGPDSNAPSMVVAKFPDTFQQLHLVVETWSISRSSFYEALHAMLECELVNIQSLKLQLVIDPSPRCQRQVGQHGATEERADNPEDYINIFENTAVSEMCKNKGIAFEITAGEFSGNELEDEWSWS